MIDFQPTFSNPLRDGLYTINPLYTFIFYPSLLMILTDFPEKSYLCTLKNL